MEKINKFLIIILLVSTTIIGCTKNKTNLEDENTSQDTLVDEERPEGEKVMRSFFELIKAENKASDLGVFIKKNIEQVDKSDGDEMIQWLLIYQTEIINDLNYKITDPEYLNALNENMNGILDEAEIHSIEDEKVRRDYQELIDGLMTIRRYEETPVVETDWKALNKLSSYVSDDLATIIELYQKNQYYEYNRDELDEEDIVNDILKVEDILKNHKSEFIYSLANELYELQIASLLIGPEGNYLGFFVYKDSKEYKSLIRLKDDYLDSYYGNMIAELDKETYENPMDVYDKIDKYLNFGIQSKNYLDFSEFKEDNVDYNIFEIKIPEDEEKQNRINNMIKTDIKEYFEERIEEGLDYTISVYSNYQDNKYISYHGYVYFNYESDNPKEINLYKVLDYEKERFVGLEEYLETDLDSLKIYLKDIKGIDINSIPDFQINNNGIDLLLDGVQGMNGYIKLSKKDLIEYLTLDKLIKKY